MKLVVFGLTISSSWGNGHAMLWRGLCRALAARGHHVAFFEHDVPYYASTRDLWEVPGGGELILYDDWEALRPVARRRLADADVAMVTSYCYDAVPASELVLGSPARLRVFYDMDTPVTLAAVRSGQGVAYLPDQGLGDFDLVLSYTGGRALTELRDRLGARRVAPLYGHVDGELHRRVAPVDGYRADLSYLGTYAADRQEVLDRLMLEPARRLPDRRFVIGGALYPHDFPWTPNIFFVRHMPLAEHPAFYSSSRMTVNVTRRAMAEMGYCPSGRLFEAAACGCPVLSDTWEGIDAFFEPGAEILAAADTEQAMAALALSDDELGRIGRAARERTLAEHTAAHRVLELESILEETLRQTGAPALGGAAMEV
ncbi:MAG TPA: glycosyltransferase [Longimicrobiales bacterium]|nr:glycosyltransferase [Longimicrobiales bacterium]